MSAATGLPTYLAGVSGLAPARDTFELFVAGVDPATFRVASFRGTEGLSRLSSFRVRALDMTDAVVSTKLDKARAELVLGVADGADRVVSGIITAVADVGVHVETGHRAYELRIAPRMWRLRRRTNSRIFQEKTLQEIVEIVLAEHRVARRWVLTRPTPRRMYCVQYQESDYAFVTRLLAEEGIFFYFEDPTHEAVDGHVDAAPPETLVLCDDARNYPAIAPDPWDPPASPGRPPAVPYRDRGEGCRALLEDSVVRFDSCRRVRSGAVTLHDYDYKRPNLDLTARASGGCRASAAELSATEIYDHHGEFEETDVNAVHAAVYLEQHRVDAWRAEGESSCRRFYPGARFQLTEHENHELDGDYALTRVDHTGVVPEFLAADERGKPVVVYKNTFECVPAAVAFRPKRPARTLKQVVETAVVVGPKNEEIHTDAYGRIKVQFHWDREGKRNEYSSCWIRPTQAWAGAGWGFQFIPRIGMEVLVTFIGGDADRPVVIGALYNGTHPVPHPLPAHKTRSGIRSQSTPGDIGYNEIAFEDAAGAEELYFRAQRDLRELVLNDHATRIGNDQFLQVSGDQNTHVLGEQTLDVGANQKITVGGDRVDVVSANASISYGKDLSEVVGSNELRRTEGRATREVGGDAMHKVGGDNTTMVRGLTPRASLHYVDGTSRLVSTGMTEISSDKEIVLRCGKSVLRIKPDGIEMVAPQVRVRAPGAGMSFSQDAMEIRAKDGMVLKAKDVKIQAETSELTLNQTVKLASPKIDLAAEPSTLAEGAAGAEVPTKIELLDHHKKPIAYQHYVVLTAKGERIGGMVGKDGKDEIFLEDGDRDRLPRAREGRGEVMKPYVVQAGDYLAKIANAMRFVADDVWNHPMNAALATSRSPNVLNPGDILHVPDVAPTPLPLKRGQSNTYVSEVPEVEVVFTLRLDDGTVLKNEEYIIEGLGDEHPGVSGEDGVVRFTVPIEVTQVHLLLFDRALRIPILVGHLDPVETLSGQRARLENLGFQEALTALAAYVEHESGNPGGPGEAECVARGLAAFQRSKKMPITGLADRATLDALVAEHGS